VDSRTLIDRVTGTKPDFDWREELQEPMETILTTRPVDQPMDEWLGEPTLRRRLRFSRSTIRRLRARGLPSIGSGRLRRYRWASVVDWLVKNA
jgi:hypothetical protein